DCGGHSVCLFNTDENTRCLVHGVVIAVTIGRIVIRGFQAFDLLRYASNGCGDDWYAASKSLGNCKTPNFGPGGVDVDMSGLIIRRDDGRIILVRYESYLRLTNTFSRAVLTQGHEKQILLFQPLGNSGDSSPHRGIVLPDVSADAVSGEKYDARFLRKIQNGPHVLPVGGPEDRQVDPVRHYPATDNRWCHDRLFHSLHEPA